MTKITHVAAGILIRADGQFLLGSRPAGKPYAGWWEFPGGKIEAGETPYEALVRELHEEMGIAVLAATPWVVQCFVYEHATVRLNFFLVTAWDGDPQPHEGQSFAWQQPGSLNVEPVLPANAPILRGLQLPAQLALSNAAELGVEPWLACLRARLQGSDGLRLLVLREPQCDAERYRQLAEQVIPLVQQAGGKVLLHGHTGLASRLGADGVHLSSRQLLACTVRPDGWCGASVHNEQELTRAAELALDYVVLGSVLPTQSHPAGPTLGWDGYARLVAQGWPLPVYALGGMHPDDVATARQAGGHGVAMQRAAWVTSST